MKPHEPSPEGYDEILPITNMEPHPVVLLIQKIGLAGASNACGALATNPMDLVKVRQQLRTTSSSLNPSNSLSVLSTMIKEEGPLSIYKGLSAALIREGSYSGIRMGTYDYMKEIIKNVFGNGVTGNEKEGFAVKLGAGMMSGMVGSAIANPADLLKVRLQTPSAVGSLSSHISTIYTTQGIAGFYRAVGPTIVRAGILTSVQMGTYDQSKHLLMNDFPNLFKEGFMTHLAASGMAGLCCSIASSPVDVVKVRMMSDKNSIYRSSLHCTALLLSQEGPLAFYKGFTMCFLRLWPHSVISLLVFEQLRKAAGLKPVGG